MSERPEPDKTVDKTVEKPPVTTTVTATKSDDHPMTAEKPGTGKPEKPPKFTDKAHMGFSGHDRYPDGYKMERSPSGQISLTNPNQEQAVWNQQTGEWVDGVGDPMPEGWSHGHFPDTQVEGPHSH